MKLNLENNLAIEVGVIILDDSYTKTISVQLIPYLKPLVLWRGDEYDKAGDYTQVQVENRIKELITTTAQLTNLYIHAPIDDSKIYKNFTDPLNYTYNIPSKTDTLIIIAYFSPCNYAKPKQNLNYVVNKLIQYEHPVCIVEAVMPNADPLVLPYKVLHHKIAASNKSYMFLKENLYNIAIQKYKYNKYIFLDSDVFFDKSDWFDQTSILLDSNDIVQPFENAFWINKENNEYILTRQSTAKCLVKKAAPSGTMYHPGLAWGATAEFLNKIGGFFDQCVIGGGDLALWYGLDNYSTDPIKNMAGTIAESSKNHNMFYHLLIYLHPNYGG